MLPLARARVRGRVASHDSLVDPLESTIASVLRRALKHAMTAFEGGEEAHAAKHAPAWLAAGCTQQALPPPLPGVFHIVAVPLARAGEDATGIASPVGPLHGVGVICRVFRATRDGDEASATIEGVARVVIEGVSAPSTRGIASRSARV